ncbi:unnamed protein product [Amoebophrya sp. A25]|nr:unnamed protein product [Amoebophrya sp. A25]|eukprot:GSA25T00024889001.1
MMALVGFNFDVYYKILRKMKSSTTSDSPANGVYPWIIPAAPPASSIVRQRLIDEYVAHVRDLTDDDTTLLRRIREQVATPPEETVSDRFDWFAFDKELKKNSGSAGPAPQSSLSSAFPS